MNDMILTNLTGHDIWMLTTVIACSVFLLDDLFVDALAIIKGKKAEHFSESDMQAMLELPEKKIAIMIANWHEAEIIERIVTGNIHNISYSNYEMILGVYPNDTETLAAARRVEKRFGNVTVIVNTKDGPTSKGQMLNQMVRYIDGYNNDKTNSPFDIVVIQDSEDIMHQYSFKLMNERARNFDFIQIPVFSLDVPLSKMTAGIYIDEFTESHTKDLLVRDHFKAGMPSAGVGTAVTWSAVKKLLKLQDGQFLNENTLTEDYHLGLTCHDLKMKSNFACVSFDRKDKDDNKTTEYIATREFFPQKLRQSIRQKTRWSLGISLQGFEHRKWKSAHAFETYFLWRDRKGLVNAPLFTISLLFTIYFIATWFMTGTWPSLDYTPLNPAFTATLWANLIFSVFRIVNRMRLVTNVYGFKMAILVPIRWIVSNFVNTASTYNALYQWTSAKIRGELPKWAKTDHVVPAGFGLQLDFAKDEPTTDVTTEPIAKTENKNSTLA